MKTSMLKRFQKMTGQSLVKDKFIPSKYNELSAKDWEHVSKILRTLDKILNAKREKI